MSVNEPILDTSRLSARYRLVNSLANSLGTSRPFATVFVFRSLCLVVSPRGIRNDSDDLRQHFHRFSRFSHHTIANNSPLGGVVETIGKTLELAVKHDLSLVNRVGGAGSSRAPVFHGHVRKR